MIVIVDLALGNLFSVKRAIEHVGGEVVVSDDRETISNAEKIVLPGVGSFKAGMEALVNKELVDCIKERVEAGGPLLGICLGMQLLMDESEENGLTKGLGLIAGSVVYFRNLEGFDNGFKVPNIGWSSLLKNPFIGSWKNTILNGFTEGDDCYFVHSYCVVPEDTHDSLAITHYGESEYCAVTKRDNVTGCQFHPEKSGDAGLKIISAFVQND